MKVSIIVPIYNGEKHIKRCVDSLLAQKGAEIEILLINDGSTDSTDVMLTQYQTQYPDIVRVLSKKKEGVAKTRNLGIQEITGDYFLFVDVDDYLSTELIQQLAPYLEKGMDLIKFKLQKVEEDGTLVEKVGGPTFETIPGELAFSKLAFSDVLLDSPCVYIFKKELFTKNALQFKIGTEHEDFGLIPLVLIKAKTVVSTPFYGYYYVQTKGSIMRNENHTKEIKKMEDVLGHYDTMLLFIQGQELDKKTKKDLKSYYTNAILSKLGKLIKQKKLTKQEENYFIQEIKRRNMSRHIQIKGIRQIVKRLLLIVHMKWYFRWG